MAPKPATRGTTMKATESMLVEIDTTADEFHLSLMDGSNWLVNPDDLPTAGTWQPTAKIRIEFQLDDSTFSYRLTNLTNDISIRAMKIG